MPRTQPRDPESQVMEKAYAHWAPIYDAGLATRGNGGQIYDRFRARITFPLCDSRGRVSCRTRHLF